MAPPKFSFLPQEDDEFLGTIPEGANFDFLSQFGGDAEGLEVDDSGYSSPAKMADFLALGSAGASAPEAFTPPSFATPVEPEAATPFNRSSTLQARMAELASKESEAYKAALETPHLDKSKAFALALPTLLGTLIGAAFRGKKGANVGMQAGAAGSLLGLKGEQADLENKQKLNLINAQRLEKRGAGLEKAQLDDEKARLKFENDKDLIDYRGNKTTEELEERKRLGLLFKPGSSTELDKPISEEQRKTFSEMIGKELPASTTNRDMMSIRQLAGQDKADKRGGRVSEKTSMGWGQLKGTLGYVGDLRQVISSTPDFDSRKIGQAVAQAKPGFLKGVAESLLGKGSEGSALQGQAFARAASSLDPNSTEFKVFNQLRNTARQMAIASEVGVLTEQDVSFYYDMMTPRAAETNDSFAQRLDDVMVSLTEKAKGQIAGVKAGGRDVSEFEKMFDPNQSKIVLSPEERAKRLEFAKSKGIIK